MTESAEDLLSAFIVATAEELDIPRDLERQARDYYHALGNWLVAYGEKYGGAPWTVQPQGSFNLGTVVMPIHKIDEYDIDLVCTRFIKKSSTTQKLLKEVAGDALRAYVQATATNGVPELDDEGRRCWTLLYPRFHMDTLPVIPDEEVGGTALEMTDTTMSRWLKTNPAAYALWFRRQMEQELLAMRKHLAAARSVHVEDVPEWEVRTILQRIVQSLKRHRDIFYVDDLEMRPPSVLITTLAGLAYQPHVDFYGALVDTVKRMPDHIDRVGKRISVLNPVCNEEDFGERISDDPVRLERFDAWMKRLHVTLEQLPEVRGGIPKLTDRLAEDFGHGVSKKAASKVAQGYRQARGEGVLKMATGTGMLGSSAGHTVSSHTFRGGED